MYNVARGRGNTAIQLKSPGRDQLHFEWETRGSEVYPMPSHATEKGTPKPDEVGKLGLNHIISGRTARIDPGIFTQYDSFHWKASLLSRS
jgi:hypothetical protein